MTTQKDFKRLVRGRMQKTGESYTTARASLLKSNAERTAPSAASNGHAALNGTAASVAKPQATDFAKIAGMSDEKVKAATGCTWEKWVWHLDQVDAHKWPHREIAAYVHEKYKVPSWWTQTVTVGYERIRGLREKGQQRSGVWRASKSKTVSAAAGRVFNAFKQPKQRTPWLPNKVAIRTTVPNKSLRLTWEDGSSVEVYLVVKGRSKSTVTVEHTKLASRAEADRMKEFWSAHLDGLAMRLAPKA